MIPQNVLSSVSVTAALLSPDTNVTSPLEDFERGGLALGDSSLGLNYRNWRCFVKEDGSSVAVQADSDTPTTIFTLSGIERLSFTFDQNMRPCVAYELAGSVYLRWYDSFVEAYVTTAFPSFRSPRVTLDDKRRMQLANRSDIIFAYIKGSDLCFRMQRDRYTIEYVLRSNISSNQQLANLAMNKALRLQFDLV